MSEFPIRIPRVSMATSEATLVEHLVADGQRVDEGEPLYVIETEKVDQELEAPESGVVHWTAEVGEIYEVGTQIGHIVMDD